MAPTFTKVDHHTLGQSLPWNQTLVSEGGNFELGFFSRGRGNSTRHYIGIWFKNISKQTVVWLANRERPVLEPSTSRFALNDRGELVLLAAPSSTLLWSSNATSPSPRTTVATLQDDGNLVVRSDATASASSVVTWQSFDHPTDTWLPGASLGYDRARGVHSFLTSWTNAEDPAPGPFSLVIDPRGQTKLNLLAGGEHQYWTTGLWDGQIFVNLYSSALKDNQMRSGYIAGVPYAPNASINLFTYHDRMPMGIRNFVLDVNGQLLRRQWSDTAGDWNLFCSEPRDPCDVHASCGPFGVCSNTTSPACQCPAGFAPRLEGEWRLGNMASGCERRQSQQQADCHTDGFLELPYAVQLPRGSAAGGARSGRAACELSCLRDCSCAAYVYDGTKCSVWKGELVNLRRVSSDQVDQGVAGAVLHLRVAASELPAAVHPSKKSTAIHGTGLVAGVLILTSLVITAPVVVVLRRRRGKGKVTPAAAQGALLVFDYRAMKEATRDFSEKLGSGGFGSVYKGALPDATPVAVKTLHGWRQQGDKPFRAEVVTLGMIHHVNLVRLRSFCWEGSKRALVYDYMANGSLDSHLFITSSSSSKQRVLSWDQRFGIAVGVVRGLAYLHEECRERIIHCDVKPENILLDEALWAKHADFGMAKLVGRDSSRVLTTVRGTPGYLAPEWLAGAPVTAKADVYSFGLVLFELVSGRRNAAASSAAMYFPVHAAVRLRAGDVVSLLDERLSGDANLIKLRHCLVQLERLCKVACWCIQDEERDRPTMGLVVQQLEGVADVGLPPIPRC
ncbi:G-type lectin S-receptor-like serine/threonine-protein kinase At2g19130 [Panicum virgatum]|uniref:G-type lectin S-receptor-like serine/threonine-protein kinase At2g19130 n=1 Tax=Panicum virgatum TaxID=38727 RepID=UPI0019D50E10|nr:G-type lectin S-receptor-like serine/threonine-protein kinase At2g19130 [Panicum virgatum]